MQKWDTSAIGYALRTRGRFSKAEKDTQQIVRRRDQKAEHQKTTRWKMSRALAGHIRSLEASGNSGQAVNTKKTVPVYKMYKYAENMLN